MTRNTLKGKTIIVTGATGGIGETTALELARMGADVTIAGRTYERCQAASERIRTKYPAAHLDYLAGDLFEFGNIHSACNVQWCRFSTRPA